MILLRGVLILFFSGAGFSPVLAASSVAENAATSSCQTLLKMKPLRMLPRYDAERVTGPGSIYLDEEERPHYEAVVENGRIGRLRHGQFRPLGLDGENDVDDFLFVIGLDGKIYTARNQAGSVPFHSSFLAGEDVLFAGHLWLNGGQVRMLSNASGHYQPSVNALYQAADLLREMGVHMGSAVIAPESESARRLRARTAP